MKASELRLGNWIEFDGKKRRVIALAEDDVVVENFAGCGMAFKGIPLTPEILEAAGFDEIMTKYGIYQKGVLRIAVSISAAFVVQNQQVISLRILVDYVHQLQNIYFALTGQELPVKIPQLA